MREPRLSGSAGQNGGSLSRARLTAATAGDAVGRGTGGGYSVDMLRRDRQCRTIILVIGW